MPEPADDDVHAVTAAVLTASRLLVAVSARSLAAAQEHVTLPQFRMLVVLAGAGEMKLVALADRLAVNPSTAMRMINRLTAVGLVARQINDANRRETRLHLTAAGQRIVDDVTTRRRDEIAAIVARMPPAQRGGLIKALRAFATAGDEPSVTASAPDPIPLGWD